MKDTIRILQVVESRRRRGAEVFAWQLSRFLRNRGWDVRQAYLQRTVDESCLPLVDGDVDLVSPPRAVSGRISYGLRAVASLVRQIHVFAPHIVQSNGGSTFKRVAQSAWLSPRRRWKFIYRNVGDPRMWVSDSLRKAYYRLLAWPPVDGVAAVSQQAVVDLRSMYGETKTMRVIPTGIDLDHLEPTEDRMQARKSLLTKANDFAIVWVGSLSQEKRPDLAVRVLSSMCDQGIPARLWIIGHGPLQNSIEQLGNELGVRDRVSLVGETIHVGTYLIGADALLLTSETEGVPAVAIEAQLLGLPVVASSVGGVPEVIEDRVTGFLARAGNILDYVEGLRFCREDREATASIADRARNVALAQYTIDTVGMQFEQLYKTIVGPT